ncbi:MAG: hypothetical protein AAF824_02235 [Bacteroidota bacterium]
MKYLSYITKTLICLVIMATLSSCEEEELAFEVVASPVLAVFENTVPVEAGNISVTATFYDLDKSGILDNSVGIDSVPISGLSVDVFINEATLLGNLVTDGSGKTTFETAATNLQGSSRLEWVGEFDGQSFRIYKNL